MTILQQGNWMRQVERGLLKVEWPPSACMHLRIVFPAREGGGDEILGAALLEEPYGIHSLFSRQMDKAVTAQDCVGRRENVGANVGDTEQMVLRKLLILVLRITPGTMS